jgi:hypothetical protein
LIDEVDIGWCYLSSLHDHDLFHGQKDNIRKAMSPAKNEE